MHISANAMACDLCSFKCKTANGLYKHKLKHAALGPEVHDLRKVSLKSIECSNCNKKFRFLRNLAMHNKSCKGDDTRIHLCEVCGELFENKKRLSEHLMRKSHKVPLHCPLPTCGKIFFSKKMLQSHSTVHAPPAL